VSEPAPADLLEQLRDLEARVADLRVRIAGDLAREEVPSGSCPVLVCRIGEERVAFLQSLVAEVVLMAKLTALPEAPAWIAGLLNLRGSSIVVLDTLARLRRSPRRPLLSDRIVICELHGRRVGLVVQEILAVETVVGASLQRPARADELAPYLLGAFQREDSTTLLLSLAALLSTSSLPAEAPG